MKLVFAFLLLTGSAWAVPPSLQYTQIPPGCHLDPLSNERRIVDKRGFLVGYLVEAPPPQPQNQFIPQPKPPSRMDYLLQETLASPDYGPGFCGFYGSGYGYGYGLSSSYGYGYGSPYRGYGYSSSGHCGSQPAYRPAASCPPPAAHCPSPSFRGGGHHVSAPASFSGGGHHFSPHGAGGFSSGARGFVGGGGHSIGSFSGQHCGGGGGSHGGRHR